MQDLILHEQFECEVLEYLNRFRLLDPLVFGGGTMLRLCHGLNRYSVDLDFWIHKPIEIQPFFLKIQDVLSKQYLVKDAMDKHFSLVFEIKSHNFPRSLKIEIRKESNPKRVIERSIVYSEYSTIQVMLYTVSLQSMIKEKISAFLDRKEIRDIFDIEFLVKKGVPLDMDVDTAKKVFDQIDRFKTIDYKSKLGSIISNDQRMYYNEKNFYILKEKLKQIF